MKCRYDRSNEAGGGAVSLCGKGETQGKASVLFIVRRLLKEKVGRQLLVLVASKICLDDQIALEAQTAELQTVMR